MIGLNYLGKMGQLGNQMFQYAALKGIARNRGLDFIIPNHGDAIVDSLGNTLRIELFEPFNIESKYYGFIETNEYIQEAHFHFDEDLYNNCPDNSSLYGFFQSPKYFLNIREEIIKDFKFKKQIINECKSTLKTFDNPIALHIRRGDFLINSANHYNLPMSYYENGLDCFDEDRQVVIFSDDPEWCFEQKLFDNDRFLVSQSNSPYHDLYLMTQCSDFIIANSTYSWWGAWLCMNPFKEVIYPNRWFGPNNASKSTADLFPRSWRIINED